MSTAEEPQIRLCKGDCGRMTRPRNTPARNAENVVTGTICRMDGRYCSPCYRKFHPAAQAEREREEAKRERERAERLQAAFNARNELAAGREYRQKLKAQREKAEAARKSHQRMARLVSA